jgi:acyl-CoA thioesterase
MVTTFPRPSDVELLGLDFDPDYRRARFELVPGVARHNGALYGGTAIAVSVAAMEAATGRPSLWVTTQYVATAGLSDIIECTTDVLANGRNISQAQVTGRHGDRVLFVSVGSTATPREDGMEGQYQDMLEVAPPEATGPMVFGPGGPRDIRGFMDQVEYRLTEVPGDTEGAPQLAMWARIRDGRPMTPAGISFVADMVPGAIARVAGQVGGGASLDNSLRFGRIPDDEEWVLLELRAQMAVGAHAHGSVKVWSRGGVLLAVGGQSANMSRLVPTESA